ncbi:hypothetical protein K438DRAFT_1964275 [Mycena galopus ATCC 62051]|nr:hypothetical protein K438DRAFT_1964275 [Mycena galopus ATCC 62051]
MKTFAVTKEIRAAASTQFLWSGAAGSSRILNWVARQQSERYVNSHTKSFKTWDDKIHWWNQQCNELHQNGCPPFEAVTFSLAGDPRTQPGPGPCTFYAPLSVAHARAATDDVAAPATANAPDSAVASIVNRGDLFLEDGVDGVTIVRRLLQCPSTSASSASLSSMRSPRVKTEDVIPDLIPPPKEEPYSPRVAGVTLNTRVHLTPTGRRYAESLQLPSPTPANTPTPTNTPTPAGRRAPAAPALPSIAATPHAPHARVPGAAAVPAAPAPSAGAARRHAYGIHGVPVFYVTYGSALAAALKLGLDDSKIMFSENAEKLEQWMLGKPFLGEE